MVTDEFVIGTGNEDQAAAWDGDEGRQWAEHPEFYDLSVRHHHARLLERASIRTGEQVLDVGCGNGQTTIDAARQTRTGSVLGIDLSTEMLAGATARAARAGVGNVAFVHGDAQVYPFPEESYDVVLSRFAAMFLADQRAAFANLASALRPGGRLAVMSWRHPDENEWIATMWSALAPPGAPHPARPGAPLPPPPSPFGHADPDRTREVWNAAGLTDVEVEPVDAPMYFGAGADQAYAVLRVTLAWMTGDVDDAAREAAFARLYDVLRARETPEGVAFRSAAWLYTARRPG